MEFYENIRQYWWWPYAENILIITAALTFGFVVHFLLTYFLKRKWSFLPSGLNERLLPRISKPLCLLITSVALHISLPTLTIPDEWIERAGKILLPITIIAFGWFVIQTVRGIGDWIMQKHIWSTEPDNLKARQISTKVHVLLRVITFIIGLLTIIGVAMTIPSLRTLGLSLFASAGVAGLVIGMAARSTLSNLTAGLQLGLTQPIRIDDVVIVEKEYGRVEEINNTYVVVCLWDLRRMIVPLTYFLEKPFENWTHKPTNMLGTVMIYVDYTIPLAPLKEELDRVVRTSPLWDGKTCSLQVTDLKEETMELRIVVSANGTNIYNLRCYIREQMIDYIQREYPDSLPKKRAYIQAETDNLKADPQNRDLAA